MSDVTFDIQNNSMEVHEKNAEPWKITLVDTGINTNTGGRLKRVKKYIEGEKSFCFTYGDGLSDVPIDKLVNFHHSHHNLATVTSVIPPGRYGNLILDDSNFVKSFIEKPQGDGGQINGGFFVLSPKVLNYISVDSDAWEGKPLSKLSADKELKAFVHRGFWQPMDTLRDKNYLETLWQENRAPWKKW
jgi:glucose-1-phosphate cytidylyltransferase